MAKSAPESGDNGLEEGEVLQKWGGTRGNFGSAGADRRPLGALQMKIVQQRRGQARWVYYACCFRGRKANPDLIMIADLQLLWAESLGDPRVCVAVIDGLVDESHPSLIGANLTHLETHTFRSAKCGSASEHGTHIASLIFGQRGGPIQGIAPLCRGLIVPVFAESIPGVLGSCSQIDLARAILQAVQHGARVINISGGQFVPSGAAHPILADAVQYCVHSRVLVVASVGNDGCDCLHVPGALPAVLAVGGMNSEEAPLDFSNWGGAYESHGILAPGENIVGATPGGDIAARTGTSYATAVVSGVAALLLSIQLKLGREVDPQSVREALLRSALGCDYEPVADCRRLLAGRLNISGSLDIILGPTVSLPGATTMPESVPEGDNPSGSAMGLLEESPPQTASGEIRSARNDSTTSATPVSSPHPVSAIKASSVASEDRKFAGTVNLSGVAPPACSCGCPGSGPAQLVYVLGQLGFDFGTDDLPPVFGPVIS